MADALDFHIVQINQGFSVNPYTLRGLHFQEPPYEQTKLISCLHGKDFSAAVDIRKNSPTFGQYAAEILSKENQRLMYIPKGFAHGYLTLESSTLIQWYVDNNFFKEKAKCLRDNSCGIKWPVADWNQVVLSEKDRSGMRLEEI